MRTTAPSYADAEDKIVVFFQDAAHLDDGDIWPVSYALTQWSPSVEERVVELLTKATG